MEIPPAPMTARVGSEFGCTVSGPRLDVTTASRVACESAGALRTLLRPVWGQELADVTARKLACLAMPDATGEREFRRPRRLKVWSCRDAWDDAVADGDPANLGMHPGRRQVLVRCACSPGMMPTQHSALGARDYAVLLYSISATPPSAKNSAGRPCAAHVADRRRRLIIARGGHESC